MIIINKNLVMVHIINTNDSIMDTCTASIEKAEKKYPYEFVVDVLPSVVDGSTFYEIIKCSAANFHFFVESDCIIIDEEFFSRVLECFEDEKVGLVSVFGNAGGMGNIETAIVGSYAQLEEGGDVKVVKGQSSGRLVFPSHLVWCIRGKVLPPDVSADATPGAVAMECWQRGLKCVVPKQEMPLCVFAKLDENRVRNAINELLPIYGLELYRGNNDCAQFGKRVKIANRVHFVGGIKSNEGNIIKFGDDVTVGDGLYVYLSGPITINHQVKIGRGVSIGDSSEEDGSPIKETFIDYGAIVGDDVKIKGGIRVGRFANILVGSVVENDVPAYTVVAGNPARVVAIYDYRTFVYVPVESESEVGNLLRERMNNRPLITIGIPTYNRSQYLSKSLEAIFNTVGEDPHFEILVSDNHSEDGTKELSAFYHSRYSNMTILRNSENLGAARNFENIYNNAKGEYVFAVGDDDYYENGVLYELLSVVKQNRNCGVISIIPVVGESGFSVGVGPNAYLGQLSYWCTWVSSSGLRTDVAKEIAVDCVHNRYFSQVEKQFSVLDVMPEYVIVNMNVVRRDSGEALYVLKSDYEKLDRDGKLTDLTSVFIKEYIDTLSHCKQFGLTDESIHSEKKKVLVNFILPWIGALGQKNKGYSRRETLKYYDEYYSNEDYYLEGRKMLEERLAW